MPTDPWCSGGATACSVPGWKPFQNGIQLACDALPPPNSQYCRCQPGQWCTAPNSIKQKMVCPGTATIAPPIVPMSWTGVCPKSSVPDCPGVTTCLTPAGGNVPCPDGTCPPMTGYACDTVLGCVPSSTSTLSFADCSSQCRYDCAGTTTSVNRCAHVLNGKYSDPDCGGKCGTAAGGNYECTGMGCVPTPTGALSAEDCSVRCRWQCGGNGLCVRQLNGTSTERTCGGQCSPYAGGWRCDPTSGCVQDPASSLSLQDCTARCGSACVNGACGFQFGSTASECPADCGTPSPSGGKGTTSGVTDVFQANLGWFIALFVLVGVVALVGVVYLVRRATAAAPPAAAS